MKKILYSIAATLVVAATAHAGVDKVVVAPATDSKFYVGIDGGINAAQNNIWNWDLGQDNNIKVHKKVGWTTGLKLGYLAGSSQDLVRPAVELEGIYTGFDRVVDVLNTPYPNDTAKASFRTFAYMANGIAKFNLGAFQPYVGAGAGFFSSKIKYSWDGSSIGAEKRDGFAWQLLTGVDYTVTPTISLFTEYQWLNCLIRNRMENFTGHSLLGQHLVTAGVRFHF